MSLPDPSELAAETCRRVPGWLGAEPQLQLIEKGGSDRHYFRCTARTPAGEVSAILMVYTLNRPDNPAFFPATDLLQEVGVRVPRVFYHDSERRVAWIEDLGRDDLCEYRAAAESERLRLYRSALRQAARVHAISAESLGAGRLGQLQKPFDAALYGWEQNYFLDEFASRLTTAGPDTLDRLRRDPGLIALRDRLAALPRYLVHRDFQSQNIIIRDGKAWLIDYQGLRPGRPEYDVASLLWDPYVELSDAERTSLSTYYFRHRLEEHGWDGGGEEILVLCAVQRLMQALGAYGKLSHRDGKTEFLKHVRPALSRLRTLIHRHGVVPMLDEALHLRPGALEAARAAEEAAAA